MSTKKARPIGAAGWLREWLVLGTFAGEPARLLTKAIVLEPSVHPKTNDRAKGRSWRVHASPDHYVDLRASQALTGVRDDCVAYAHVYLLSDRARSAELLFGSDDGCAIWVNGRRLFCREAQRPALADEDCVSIELAEGYNRLLVKVQQYGGAWGFLMRIAGPGRTAAEGISYVLDDPKQGAFRVDPAPVPPCVLAAGPVPPEVYTEASQDTEIAFPLSIANVSGKRIGPGTVKIAGATGDAIAEVPFGAIAPYAGHVASFPIRARAWVEGVRLTALQGKRRISTTLPCRADALGSFLVRSRGARIEGVSPAMLERVQFDLSAGPAAILGDAELTRAVSLLAEPGTPAAAVDHVDRMLAEHARTSKGHTVFLVGHAHIDMNWLWRWPETVQVCRDTFRQALAFMDEFADFRFSQSQASVYEAMEREDPALFDRIKKAVASGRWEVTGGMWTEGDTNLSSGEALCRSFLLAQRWFRDKLGVAATTGWLPDNFGHAAQLPQLLRLSGIDTFYHMRCGPPVTQVYRWRGPDGSTVLAKTGQGYNDQVLPSIRHEVRRAPEQVGAQMFVYGVGDHGGGPTRRDITAARAYTKNRLFPELRLATTREYFARAQLHADDLPICDGELQFIFDGCYTNVSRVKQGNRRLENALQTAEALAVCASRIGLEYPTRPLADAWQTLVFNQFHDILPGSAIHESNLDSVARYQHALETCRLVRDACFRFIAERIRIANDDAIPLVVFNPLAHERGDVVVADIITARPVSSVRVRSDTGEEIPAQIVRTRRFDAYEHFHVQFSAPSVSGLGHRVFFVEPVRTGTPVPIMHWSSPYPPMIPLREQGGTIALEGTKVHSKLFDLEFDKRTGAITSLVLKGRQIVGKGGLNRLAVFLEGPHDMSAWNLDPEPRGPVDLRVTAPVEVLQVGRESVSWAASFAYGTSTFRLTTTVHADSPRIDCHLVAEWAERGTHGTRAPMLRALFGLAAKPGALTCDTPFAAVDRKPGREVPAQKWADAGGLALLNRGKYGHSLVDGTIRLTLLRSAYDPDLLPDVGRHEIEWAVIAHAGSWQQAKIPLAALSYNVPLETFQARAQQGDLGLAQSLLGFDTPEAFLVTGVKRAEDGRGIVVRGYDVTGKGAKARAGGSLAGAKAERLNIIEDPMSGSPVRLDEIEARPYEIVTLRIT